MGFQPEISRHYLQDVFSSVMLKDIVRRNNIRDVDLLERIIAYALANFGKRFSAASISKYFKKEGSFQGKYEGIPAVKIEDWLVE